MAANRTKNLRLNGINPLSYVGVNSYTPPGFHLQDRDPTNEDNKNFIIGDLWLNTDANNPPLISDLWVLVALGPNGATWRQFGGGAGALDTLTGNTGGAITPDGANNINVIGNNAVGLTVAGNPGTNTLTITTTSGISLVDSITGNVGGAVPADAMQNINLLGDVVSGLSVSGNPGTNTLTITTASTNPLLETLTGDVGGAVPADAAHNINVVGGANVTVTGNPGTNTLQIDIGGASLVDTLTGNSGGPVGPDGGGNINVLGDNNVGLDIVGNPGTNTLTVTTVSGNPFLESLTGDSGGVVLGDLNHNINIVGGTNINIAGNPGTNTLTINATGGAAGIDTLTADTGGAVGPDGAANVNILGTLNNITVTGNPGTNTLTLDVGGSVATTYAANAGSAVPSGGILNIFGTGGITTSAAGNTVSISGGGGGNSNFLFVATQIPAGPLIFGQTGVSSAFIGANPGALTELFDSGGNFYPGGGVLGDPAVFTAPVTGYYIFHGSFVFRFSGGGDLPENYLSQFFVIVSSSVTPTLLRSRCPLVGVTFAFPSYSLLGFGEQQNLITDKALVFMNAGDTASFRMDGDFGSVLSTNLYGFGGNNGSSTNIVTYLYGYLLSA